MGIGNLSDKQSISLRDSDSRLNFWVGSVRSGKSFSALLRFMQFCLSDVEGDFIIVGKSEAALKRNVISEMRNLAGDSMSYSPGNREVMLYNRRIHIVGASDERAESKIRGASFAGALVDEATIIPESFFSMLLSRLSKKGAKLFATTNPDSPFHWFKVNYLDRAKEIGATVFNFYLDDNPSLEESYKDALKKEYQGLWYSRYIEGKWVLASGTVYDTFDRNLHCITNPPGSAKFNIVGVDYGTTNPTAFIMLAYNPDVYPNVWVEKEHCYDSRVAMRQKTDSEHARDLINFIDGYHVKSIQVDPSAASFKAECYRSGISNIVDADNSVLDGIRLVATFLNEGTMKISDSCSNLMKEFQSYTWDENAARRGIEKPNKSSDHCLDGLRYSIVAMSKEMKGNTIRHEDSTFASMNNNRRARV